MKRISLNSLSQPIKILSCPCNGCDGKETGNCPYGGCEKWDEYRAALSDWCEKKNANEINWVPYDGKCKPIYRKDYYITYLAREEKFFCRAVRTAYLAPINTFNEHGEEVVKDCWHDSASHGAMANKVYAYAEMSTPAPYRYGKD